MYLYIVSVIVHVCGGCVCMSGMHWKIAMREYLPTKLKHIDSLVNNNEMFQVWHGPVEYRSHISRVNFMLWHDTVYGRQICSF